MKVLLYLEAERWLTQSGIGRAIKHQQKALRAAGVSYTTDPTQDYDLVHINSYGPKSWWMMHKAHKAGKTVVMHGHSTEEDFRDSFIASNWLSPLFRRYLCLFYEKADAIITPTQYSKSLIESYGITTPIYAVSNGIDLAKYEKNLAKERAFREHFSLSPDQPVVVCAGLYFRRKGIEDFVEVAKCLPQIQFIWFGDMNKYLIPKSIRRLVEKDHPENVTFAGYIKGDIYEGALTGADAFFFPSREETEGIVVLEALASKQHTILRDIPVYQGWLDRASTHLTTGVDGFIQAIEEVLSGRSDKREEGYRVAKARGIETVGQQLKTVYETVLASD